MNKVIAAKQQDFCALVPAIVVNDLCCRDRTLALAIFLVFLVWGERSSGNTPSNACSLAVVRICSSRVSYESCWREFNLFF